MRKWEYLTVINYYNDPKGNIDILGKLGWELVSVVAVTSYTNMGQINRNNFFLYFKREIIEQMSKTPPKDIEYGKYSK